MKIQAFGSSSLYPPRTHANYYKFMTHSEIKKHCIRSMATALKKYEENKRNGASSYSPQEHMGSFVLVEPNSSSYCSALRYTEGSGNIGISEYKVWIPSWEAIADYMDKRGNGTNSDNPPRLLPLDGTLSWVNPAEKTSQVRYTQGPEDKKWMEERDHNYVFRLEREGRLATVEPNLQREAPNLFAEITTYRKKTQLQTTTTSSSSSSSYSSSSSTTTSPPTLISSGIGPALTRFGVLGNSSSSNVAATSNSSSSSTTSSPPMQKN